MSTSKRRNIIAETLVRRHFDATYSLGDAADNVALSLQVPSSGEYYVEETY